jgi:putative DNA primase/helicase
VKAFIAGDPVMGRDPSGKPFLFTPSAGHIVAANRLPAVRDFSTGFWRRWVVCEFNRVFTPEEADRTIAQKVIKSELGAIAGWCVDGALNLIQRGHYDRPKSSSDAVEQWRVDVDSVARFLQEMTVPTKPRGKGTGGQELYNRYTNYTRRDNSQPVNRRNFSHRLQKHGVVKRRYSAGVFYSVEVLKTIRPVPNASEDALNGGQNA